jgi:hypothetical protein
VAVGLSFKPAASRVVFAWKVHVFDYCSGTSVEAGSGSFAAPASWSRLVVQTPVSVPAEAKAPVLVAVTTAPQVAASAPVELAAPVC